MESILGIDIGGTTIKGGRIVDSSIVEQFLMDTRAQEGGITTINVLKETICQLKTEEVRAIGIGVPSVLLDKNVQRLNFIRMEVQRISSHSNFIH